MQAGLTQLTRSAGACLRGPAPRSTRSLSLKSSALHAPFINGTHESRKTRTDGESADGHSGSHFSCTRCDHQWSQEKTRFLCAALIIAGGVFGVLSMSWCWGNTPSPRAAVPGGTRRGHGPLGPWHQGVRVAKRCGDAPLLGDQQAGGPHRSRHCDATWGGIGPGQNGACSGWGAPAQHRG